MWMLKVGQPLVKGRMWPEKTEYGYCEGNNSLIMLASNLSPQEINDVARGECEFAVATAHLVIFFLYRFGKTFPWSDCSFTWWLLPEENRRTPPPPIQDNDHLLFQVILAEAPKGIVKALRTVTVSPKFGRELYRLIHEDIARGRLLPDYDDRGRTVYEECATSQELLDRYAVARSKGGE